MSEKTGKPFNYRAFVSILTGFSFILMTVTGLVLFFAPSCRIARDTSWSVLGYNKDQWIDVHVWFSIVFVIASIFHIYFNWAVLVCYFKAKPVIVDIQEDTFNIDPVKLEKAITKKTKAVIPVHYGGQPCDMDEILDISKGHNLKIIEDAAHALPAYYKNRKVGTIGDVTCFSFYATKTLATGEGGMICTNDEDIAQRCSIMRLHGISKDAWKRYSAEGTWYYEVVSPGFKYNFTDIQASLGLAQLRKIDRMLDYRKEIYQKYNSAFKDNALIKLYKIKNDRESAHHLYPILLDINNLTINRAEFINKLKELGIGTSVHFIPLYRHPFYRDYLNLSPDMFPVSEFIYERIITLPIWPGMTNSQINRVAETVNGLVKKYKK